MNSYLIYKYPHGPLGGPGRFWLVQNTAEVARAKGIDSAGDILFMRQSRLNVRLAGAGPAQVGVICGVNFALCSMIVVK